LITVGLSAEVAAARARVWSALADPVELATWRPGLRAVDGTGRWPSGGATLLFRTRLHGIPLAVRETSLEAVPGERLHVRLRVGLFHCDATFSLAALGGERTRVGLQLQVVNELPVVGGTLDRFAVRRLATELAATQLMALRDWCEAARPAEQPSPLPLPALAAH
jgi:hypothetical protein